MDDENLIKSIRTSTLELDFQNIREKIEKRFKELNNNSTVPDFESQIRKILSLKSLTIDIVGEGTVEQKVITNPSGKEYPVNTVIELTPIPKEGWVFEKYAGNLSGNEVPKRIILDVGKNISVIFKRRDYPLNLTIEGEGIVEEKIISSPNGKQYPFETVVELKPVPKEGWLFESWGGDLSGNETPKNITVDKERNVIVKFRKPIFRLAENGVTCICENVKVGEKGFVNGVEYEAVDNSLLRKRLDEGANMTRLCTSLVTDLRKLFYQKVFNQPIGNWDVSNVVDMEELFRESNFNQDISNWNVKNVKNMRLMFAISFFNKPINSWNVANVQDMSEMFYRSIFNLPLDNWNVSNVTIMRGMFQESIFNQPINKWNISAVKDISLMFFNSMFNQEIGDWDVSNVLKMDLMFGITNFNKEIGKWNVSNVLSMAGMFQNSIFNLSLENWNTGKVTNMEGIFNQSEFNQNISKWDVSSVVNMKNMFNNSKFNQDISKWCVSNILSEPQNFSINSPLTIENKPKWGTCPN